MPLNPNRWQVNLTYADGTATNIATATRLMHIDSVRDLESGYQIPGQARIIAYDPDSRLNPRYSDNPVASLQVLADDSPLFTGYVAQHSAEWRAEQSPTTEIIAQDAWAKTQVPLWAYAGVPGPDTTGGIAQDVLAECGIPAESRPFIYFGPEATPEEKATALDRYGRRVNPTWPRSWNGRTGRELLTQCQEEYGGESYLFIDGGGLWWFWGSSSRTSWLDAPRATIKDISRFGHLVGYSSGQSLVKQAVEVEYHPQAGHLQDNVWFEWREVPYFLKGNTTVLIHARPQGAGIDNTFIGTVIPKALVAETDYDANTMKNGQGRGQQHIVTAQISDSPQFTIHLSATGDVWITKMQARAAYTYLLQAGPNRVRIVETGKRQVDTDLITKTIPCFFTRDYDVAKAIAEDAMTYWNRQAPIMDLPLEDSVQAHRWPLAHLQIGDRIALADRGLNQNAFMDGHRIRYQDGGSVVRRLQLRIWN